MNAINILDKFQQFNEHWTPKILGELNGQHVKIAKIKNEFIWHSHDNEDELFMVFKGTLHMDFRDKTTEVNPGEMLIVPKGVEHRPRTNGEEVYILLFEPASTLNTGGETNDEKTVAAPEWI